MVKLNTLDLWSKKNKLINIIIETPKGSRNKYAYDKELESFKLKKILSEGMMFPYNFGFIPQTLSEDGDPADVLILMDEPAFPGCILEGRLVGMIRAKEKKQNGKKFVRNDRLIAIASETHIYNNIKTINDLDSKFLEEVEHFFITYSEMKGKLFKPKGRFGPKKTIKCIQLLNEAYNKNMLK